MSKRVILPMREDGLARKKWSVSECRFLTDSGLLEPGQYELIEGEIVFKMGQDQLHIHYRMYVTNIMRRFLGAIFRPSLPCIHQAQIGIGVRDEYNDPEPDVAVLRGSDSTIHLERRPRSRQRKFCSWWKRRTAA